MVKNNSLPPASQPWVRELEKKIADLEKALKRETRRAVAPAPKQNINLESLQVGELHVGGTGMEAATITDSPVGLGWTKVVGADRVTFTSPVPDFGMEVGQILEWRMAVTATVDYAQYTDSLSGPYEAPTDPDGALAGEETEFFASFTYRIDDPTDELYEPVPTEFSFTLVNPAGGPIDATVISSTLDRIIPGTGGVVITPEGEIHMEDGVGNERPFNEITPEEAAAIQQSEAWINEAGEQLRVEADAAREDIDLLVNDVLPQLEQDLTNNGLAIADAQSQLDTAFPSGPFNVDLVQNTANAALTAANGKNVNTSGTVPAGTPVEDIPNPPTPAAGTRIEGDMHRIFDSNRVLQKEWRLTAAGTWEQVTMGDAMVSNIDVGKLSAAQGDVQDLVAQKFASKIATIIELGADRIKSGLINANRINVSDLWANGIRALVGTFSKAVVTSPSIYRDPDLQSATTFNLLNLATHSTTGGYMGGGVVTVSSGASTKNVFENTTPALTPVEAGKTYTFSAWIRPSMAVLGTNRVGIRAQGYSGSEVVGTFVPAYNSTTLEAGKWVKVSGEISPPDNATGLILGIHSSYLYGGELDVSRIEVFDGRAAVLIADGAVTANTLNVVPDAGTGGVEIKPPGIRIIPPGSDADAMNALSMRVDEPNWISFAQGNEVRFSVSPDGDVVARSLSLSSPDLTIDSEPIGDLLLQRPLGVIAHSNLTSNTYADLGWAKVAHVTFRSLAPNRRIRATLDINTNNETTPRVQIAAMRADGPQVTSNNTIQRIWEHGDGRVRASGTYIMEFNSSGTGEQSIGFFIRGRDSGGVYAMASTGAGASTRLTVEDVGPSITEATFAGVSSGGSQTGTVTSLQRQDFYPASSRSYTGGGSHYTWNEAYLFHGTSPAGYGRLRSLAVFSRTAIASFTNSAAMDSGYITLSNAHTYSNAGATVRVGLTNHTSVPSSWTGAGFSLLGEFHVAKGGTLKIPLSQSQLDGFKAGTWNTVALDPGVDGVSRYAYFTVSKTRLHLEARK